MSTDEIPPVPVPVIGRVLCMIITLLATTVLTSFLSELSSAHNKVYLLTWCEAQRGLVIKSWNRLPILVWC
jgi:hypothetical protein